MSRRFSRPTGRPVALDDLAELAARELQSTLGTGSSLVRLARVLEPCERALTLGVGTYGRRGALVAVTAERLLIIAAHPVGHRVQSLAIRSVESVELSVRLGSNVLIVRTPTATHQIGAMARDEARAVAEAVRDVRLRLDPPLLAEC